MNKHRSLLILALISIFFCFTSYGQQVRDRQKGGDDDVLVVPQGTRIQTDLSHSSQSASVTPYKFHGKVEIPVRLGFTTAIPASAKVTVLVTSRYYESPYQEPVYQELVDVTVGGKVYDIQTDRIPIQAGTAKEVAFTLTEPLEIHR